MANVKVRLLPLKSIGGVGNPGDEVWMSREDADRYVAEGYVEVIEAAASVPALAAEPEQAEPVQDHAIMKPQNKRSRKK